MSASIPRREVPVTLLTGSTDTVPDYSSASGVPSVSAQFSQMMMYREPTRDEGPPPPYPAPLPDTFPVGLHKTTPLVEVFELQSHLRLIGAFLKLREDVEATAPSSGGEVEREKARASAWAVFVARAVYRFFKWATVIQPNASGGIGFEQLPPLDVLMVWHTYMLNPHSYHEDTLRVFRNLLRCHSYPLRVIDDTIDPLSLLPFPALRSRVEQWESLTGGLPYDPPLAVSEEETVEVRCPLCPGSVETRVHLVAADGKGFAQTMFEARCEVCGGTFDHEAMRVRRFCQHAYSALESPHDSFLAGTLISSGTGTPWEELARTFTQRLLSHYRTAGGGSLPPVDMAAKFKFKMEPLEQLVMKSFQGMKVQPLRVKYVLSCYDNPYPFSLDLCSAVIRQGSFMQRIADLGWTSPSRFSSEMGRSNIRLLVRCVTRYHAFLDLLCGKAAFYVPTLDIDLSWHTHQLKAQSYRDSTLRLLRRTPDHDDKVEEGAISSWYDFTAKAWEARFGVPYSLCGCGPVEPVAPPTKKLSRLFKSSSSSTSGSGSKSPVNARNGGGSTPPSPNPHGHPNAPHHSTEPLTVAETHLPYNPRPDLISFSHDEDILATHPSEHNSVMQLGTDASATWKIAREKKLEERTKIMSQATQSNVYRNDWDRIRFARALDGGEDVGHTDSFRREVPHWGLASLLSDGVEGCVIHEGGIVDGRVSSGWATGTGGGKCIAGGCGSLQASLAWPTNGSSGRA